MDTRIYNRSDLEIYNEIADILNQLILHSEKILDMDSDANFDEVSMGIAGLLFRGVLVRADGVQQLIASGSGEQATILIRSLVEAYFGLAYMCQQKSDLEQRAVAYRYFHFVEQRKLCNEALRGPDFDLFDDDAREELTKMLKMIEQQISHEDFANIDSEYKTRKCEKKRIDNWYNMYGGPLDVRDLSARIGKEFVYILYKIHCGPVHSSDGVLNVTSTTEGTAISKPLRWAERLPYLCRVACSCVGESVDAYLKIFYPAKSQEFAKWYMENINERIDSLAESIPITIHE